MISHAPTVLSSGECFGRSVGPLALRHAHGLFHALNDELVGRLLDGRVIGRLEATLHHDVLEVAYVFGPEWWRRGYATEATAKTARSGVHECEIITTVTVVQL